MPSWAKDVKIGSWMINACSETVTEKGAFKAAAARRRCLVPADGYFEWAVQPGSTTKVPYFLHGDDVLAFAGLYELRPDPDLPEDYPDRWSTRPPTAAASGGAGAGESGRRTAKKHTWLRMFGAGLVLWILSAVVTYLIGNPNLIPTLVLLGSFLVPVTFVAWAFERRDSGEITAELVFRTFIVGGVLGASVLEAYLLHPSLWLYAGVGLIEEAVKLAALAWLTRHLAVKSMRDGLILGATVGFGFAAFESAGYALTALFTPQGLSLADLVTTELLRGLLAPVGHGLWTAVLGGLLFAWSTRGHFVLTARLALAYLGVSLLHALWDSMSAISLYLTLLLTGQTRQYELLMRGVPAAPTGTQVGLYTTLTWVGQGLIAAIGVVWLLVLIARARRERRGTAPARAYHVATSRHPALPL